MLILISSKWIFVWESKYTKHAKITRFSFLIISIYYLAFGRSNRKDIYIFGSVQQKINVQLRHAILFRSVDRISEIWILNFGFLWLRSQLLLINPRIMSYSKSWNWRRILNLASNFESLFSFSFSAEKKIRYKWSTNHSYWALKLYLFWVT